MHLAFQFGEFHEPSAVGIGNSACHATESTYGMLAVLKYHRESPSEPRCMASFWLCCQSSVSAVSNARKLPSCVLFGTTKRIPFKQLLFPVSTDALWW